MFVMAVVFMAVALFVQVVELVVFVEFVKVVGVVRDLSRSI